MNASFAPFTLFSKVDSEMERILSDLTSKLRAVSVSGKTMAQQPFKISWERLSQSERDFTVPP